MSTKLPFISPGTLNQPATPPQSSPCWPRALPWSGTVFSVGVVPGRIMDTSTMNCPRQPRSTECPGVAAGLVRHLDASLNESTLAGPGWGLHDSWGCRAHGLGCACHLLEWCDAVPPTQGLGHAPIEAEEGHVCACGPSGEGSIGIWQGHIRPPGGSCEVSGRLWDTKDCVEQTSCSNICISSPLGIAFEFCLSLDGLRA